LLISLVCPELRKYRWPTIGLALTGLVRESRRKLPNPALIRTMRRSASITSKFLLLRGCGSFIVRVSREGVDTCLAVEVSGRWRAGGICVGGNID